MMCVCYAATRAQSPHGWIGSDYPIRYDGMSSHRTSDTSLDGARLCPNTQEEPQQTGGIIPATEEESTDYPSRFAKSTRSMDSAAAITVCSGPHFGFTLLSFPIGIGEIHCESRWFRPWPAWRPLGTKVIRPYRTSEIAVWRLSYALSSTGSQRA